MKGSMRHDRCICMEILRKIIEKENPVRIAGLRPKI
jgi:hypothetical protein